MTGNTDIEDSLERLDKLILEDARMASTELVKMTRNIDGSAMGVDGGVKGASGRLQDVRGDVHDIGNLVQGVEARGQDLHGDVQDVGHKVEKNWQQYFQQSSTCRSQIRPVQSFVISLTSFIIPRTYNYLQGSSSEMVFYDGFLPQTHGLQ